MKKWILLLLLLIALGTLAVAQPSSFKSKAEPDGFRGLRWGTPISGLDDMVQVWEEGERTFYERKDDLLELGGAKIHRIVYIFWRGRFFEARVSILKDYENLQDEFVNFRIVKELCFDRFGERRKPLLGKEQYSWYGDKTWIWLGQEDPGYFRLLVGSTELLREKKAFDEDKAAQEEVVRRKRIREAKVF